MAKWKKWGLIGIGAALVIGIAAQALFKGVEVDLAVVRKGNVVATVTEKGRVVSKDTGDIYSEVQGKVKTLHVDAGDTVKKGALLAELDVSAIDEQIARLEGELKAVRGSEESAELQGAGSQVKQQQLAVDQARVALNQANSAYSRLQKLYAEGAVTLAELEQARTDQAAARKTLEQAQAALAAAKKQSQGSALSFQGQKESLTAQLSYLRSQKVKAGITADRDGTVFVKKIRAGDAVAPGDLLFTVGSLGRVNIEAYVNAKDMANVKKGDDAAVVFKEPGEDIKASGVITKVSPVTEEQTSALGIIEDKIKVTIDLKQLPAGINLTPGRSVDVTLITRQAKGVPAVLKDAVFTDKNADYVWVVRNGAASLVRVETGIEGDDLTEIKKGVAAGEDVILNPHQTGLKEGIKVKQLK